MGAAPYGCSARSGVTRPAGVPGRRGHEGGETHNWCFQQNRPAYDVKPALPGVRCPTLITVGRHDWVTPVASSETIAALIPDSQLVIFEKSGHSPPSDEPELLRRVVRDFLAEVAPEA